MRLIVHCLYLLFSRLSHLLLLDLSFKELAIGSVLVNPILCFQVLHTVHVVDGRVELMLFVLSYLFYAL